MLALTLVLQVVFSPFGTSVERHLAPSDSEAIDDRARSAHDSLERIRLEYLSVDTWENRCDEYANSMCYQYGDTDDDWMLPKEDEEVGLARESLISRLQES